MTNRSFASGLGSVLIGVILLMSSSPSPDRFELLAFYGRDVRAPRRDVVSLGDSDRSGQPARVESY